MAKLKGAAKARFLARMNRGRRRKGLGAIRSKGARKRRRSKSSRRARARRVATIVQTNPSRRRRRNRRTTTMAKRRRRPRRARRVTSGRRRRRAAIMLINPGRRRHRRGRRRNPGFSFGSAARDLGKVLLPGAGAAFLMGLIDSKLLGDKALPVQIVAKLGLAAGAGYFLRKKPSAAYAAMGAIIAGASYPMGVRVGGGVVAAGKVTGVKELASLVAGDQYAMGLLLPQLQGMGVLTSEMSGMGAVDTSPPDLDGGGDTDDDVAAAMRMP